MDEKFMATNECVPDSAEDDIVCDNCRLLEVSEAIHEIDSKLRDLEIALNIREHI